MDQELITIQGSKIMTPQQIVALGIRLLAIWIGLLSVRYWGDSASELAENGQSGISAYFIGAVHILVAALLWFSPLAIAHKILPKTKFENHLNVQGMDLARAGCSLIGLFILVMHLRELIWQIFRIWAALLVSDGSTSFWRAIEFSDKKQLLFLIVMVGFATTLIVRSADFARFVFRHKIHGPGSE